MKILYKTKKLEKACTIAYEARKQYGQEMARLINQRVGEISSADTVEELMYYHIGCTHRLSGDRKNEYAMDLVHPYRLIFEKHGDKIQIAKITSIEDYH